ncbi:putative GTP-binding protein 6 [Acomys russatus]|uniref:putative GTP-binding protein 6 n=1 Tax=Acomys russatus TaxID=60746 RepID=UPI0021E21BDA|nr:putative GTP-binding protein 6 [Acomys russatus]
MLSMRAAILSGLRILRASRVIHAGARPPCPARNVSAGARGTDSAWAGRARGSWEERRGKEQGEEDEDERRLREEEEELLSDEPPLLPVAAQRVCILHPDVRGPAGRTPRPTAESEVEEASSVVQALPGWSVTRSLVVPTRVPDSKMVFGKGTFRDITEKIRGSRDITSVFLNVERMSAPTKAALEAAWGMPVFDRLSVVLHIFRCHARTREARLQLALAEVQLLRCSPGSHRDQAGWGSRYMLGSGESPTELHHRAQREREWRIRQALVRLRERRGLLRKERMRKGLPIVAVVGYTNSGKTSLIKALTRDPDLHPCDRPFATLEVTAHAGWLPSRLRVLYVDTVGFLSRLPHALVGAFAATLEDVGHADVILHVRDASSPDSERRKATVLSTLRGLRLPEAKMAAVLEVHTKADLVSGSCPPTPGAIAVSALSGLGLDELKAALEDAVLRATGLRVTTLRLPPGGPELSWLYHEATVQQVQELPDAVHVTVLISQAALGRFRKLFPGIP